MSFNEIVSVTKSILEGLGVVLVLFVVVLAASIPLGYLITLAMKSKFKVLRGLSKTYVYVIRATPLMLQIFFIYFGLPNLPFASVVLGAFPSAMIGFSLNYAAYFAEIFRGGLLSIDKGQYEACQVLGLSKFQSTVRVIIPQMVRVALPSITNESITLIKDSALMFAISVPEIMQYSKDQVARSGSVVPFIIAFVIYLVINSVLQLFFTWLEKRLSY